MAEMTFTARLRYAFGWTVVSAFMVGIIGSFFHPPVIHALASPVYPVVVTCVFYVLAPWLSRFVRAERKSIKAA